MKSIALKSPQKLGRFFWTLVILVAFIGIFFRVVNLNSDELMFDEGIYGFRSIGYLDYLENPAQITPIQKFTAEKMPAWLNLSFHDHPPLFFMIEHVFLSILGVSVFVSRLPSALAGAISIFLIFLIVRKLFENVGNESIRARKDWAGLFASALMAVSFASVSVSRLNQLEGILFCLILLNIYLFLRLLDDSRWWWAFGISLGLCFLTKYTAVFLIPVYFSYLIITHSLLLKNWRWYGGFLIAGIIFSPVIIYNIYLYGLLGHFDLQFAYLFKQATPEWGGIGGKTQEPFRNILSNIYVLYSIPFMLLTMAGLIFVSFKKNLGIKRFFTPLTFVFTVLLLVGVGSAIRFTAMLIIPAVILVTLILFSVEEKFKKPWMFMAVAVILIVYEGYFTSGLIFTNKADYGILKLDGYFEAILGQARLPGVLNDPNVNLDEVIRDYATNRPATLPLIGIVYDDEISNPARLWIFSRRQYYQGIPVMPASQFLKIMKESDGKMFKGFEIYLVKARSATTISPVNDRAYVDSLDSFMQKLPKTTKSEIIGAQGAPAFEVAHFSL